MSLLERVQAAWCWNRAEFVPFQAAGQRIGYVHGRLLETLLAQRDLFTFAGGALRLRAEFASFEQRALALEQACERLVEAGHLPALRGEPYAVASAAGPALATLDRAAALYFGIHTLGVHVNGISSGEAPRMWLARRARHKRDFPGLLDNLVGGGCPHGLSLDRCVADEAWQEASLPPALARQAVPRGSLQYRFATEDGLVDADVFVYDVFVPDDFSPRNRDGQVDGFLALGLDELVERLQAEPGAFKFNSALVALDYLVRAGALAASARVELGQLCPELYRRAYAG